MVRRGDDHDARVFPPLELSEAGCRHRPRENVAGVRANQRHQRPLNLRHGVLRQKAIHHLGELFGVGRVEAARHARGANLRRLAVAGSTGYENQYGEYCN